MRPSAILTLLTLMALAACNWPTYHANGGRTGLLGSAGSARSLTPAWSHRLDGAVYASPIVNNGTVYVATEAGSVYAFTASGALRWRAHIAAPVRLSDLASRGAPCGNIDPLGITGTPVYDAATNRVFAVAETLVNGAVQHLLASINADTGAFATRRVIPPRGNEAAHQQRGALALSDREIIVPFGGLSGDCGSYVGSLVATRDDLTGGTAVVRDPDRARGRHLDPTGPDRPARRQHPGRQRQRRVDQRRVRRQRLGRTPDRQPAVHRPLRPDDLGGRQRRRPRPRLGRAGSDQQRLCRAIGQARRRVRAAPEATGRHRWPGERASGCDAYGGAAVSGSTVFLPCSAGVRRADIAANGSIRLSWRAAGIPGAPVVYGNAVLATSQATGRLYLLDPTTGGVRTSMAVGPLSRFATPALDTGRAYIGNLAGIVAVNVS